MAGVKGGGTLQCYQRARFPVLGLTVLLKKWLTRSKSQVALAASREEEARRLLQEEEARRLPAEKKEVGLSADSSMPTMSELSKWMQMMMGRADDPMKLCRNKWMKRLMQLWLQNKAKRLLVEGPLRR
ncbi:hypothetical protein CDL15_Pgr011512 [Punica granatum]|uniref:Uncharacterized protein n=1 Tax=Punica granatum TaxID=22663 RepID=A0A218VU19_PUNGR|nr:hypothetical protein CDL15_Pgr011512 [Punica granatum]